MQHQRPETLGHVASFRLKFQNIFSIFKIYRCPVDETTSVIPSSTDGISQFTTEGFKFIADYPFVFVHCHVRICAAGRLNFRCAQGCIKETQ